MSSGEPAWYVVWAGPIAAFGTALPGVGAFIVGLRQLSAARRDRESKAAEAIDDIELRERQQTVAEKDGIIAQCKSDIADLRARNRELERDRDRGWDIARAWYSMSHTVTGKYAEKFEEANARFRSNNLPGIEFPVLPFPGFENIEPRRPG